MNKIIILLLTVTAIMPAIPVSAQIANALEDTPGTHEYFIKYIDGRQAFTNNQMVYVSKYPEHKYGGAPDLLKGRIVHEIEKGKYLINLHYNDYSHGYDRRWEYPVILLTEDNDKYSEGEAISTWALNAGNFTCTDDKGKISTLHGYRIPIPHAITFEQYLKLFNAGDLTPRKILTIYPQISSEQATAYNKEAWKLSTSTNKTVLNGAKAVTLALKASAHSPNLWSYMDTLAAAYARNGDFEKAIETLQKSINSALRLYSKGGGNKIQDALQNKLALYKNNQPYTQQPKAKPVSSTNKVKPISSYAERRQKRLEQMNLIRKGLSPLPISKQEIAEKKATEELAKLSPSELRKHVATLKDKCKVAQDAGMVAYHELRESKKQLESAEESERDKAVIAYHQAKSKNQLANKKSGATARAKEFALNFYVNSLTNSTSTIKTDSQK